MLDFFLALAILPQGLRISSHVIPSSRTGADRRTPCEPSGTPQKQPFSYLPPKTSFRTPTKPPWWVFCFYPLDIHHRICLYTPRTYPPQASSRQLRNLQRSKSSSTPAKGFFKRPPGGRSSFRTHGKMKRPALGEPWGGAGGGFTSAAARS